MKFKKILILRSLFFNALAISSQELIPVADVRIKGEVIASEDVSAIAQYKSYLVIGADEGTRDNGNYIQLLKRINDKEFAVYKDIFLYKGDKDAGKEVDIEGITVSEESIYVIGSHCLKRKKVDKIDSYKKNKKKFYESKIKDEISRGYLFEIELDSDGKVKEKKSISLKNIINNHKVLKPFSKIPSKENGVDIEGIAAKNDFLYLGFRGPVFRDNYVPVMKLKFDSPDDNNELLYVKLDGRGIRDIVSVSEGFLILAGSVGDGTVSYQLYFWNGKDLVPGANRNSSEIGSVKLLGNIRVSKDSKAEGIAVLNERASYYDLLIAFDGAQSNNDIIKHFKVKK